MLRVHRGEIVRSLQRELVPERILANFLAVRPLKLQGCERDETIELIRDSFVDNFARAIEFSLLAVRKTNALRFGHPYRGETMIATSTPLVVAARPMDPLTDAQLPEMDVNLQQWAKAWANTNPLPDLCAHIFDNLAADNPRDSKLVDYAEANLLAGIKAAICAVHDGMLAY